MELQTFSCKGRLLYCPTEHLKSLQDWGLPSSHPEETHYTEGAATMNAQIEIVIQWYDNHSLSEPGF